MIHNQLIPQCHNGSWLLNPEIAPGLRVFFNLKKFSLFRVSELKRTLAKD